MRNGCFTDTLTGVDNQKTVEVGGKVLEIYKGVIYRENFKIPPFGKVIGKYFASKKYVKMKRMIYCNFW